MLELVLKVPRVVVRCMFGRPRRVEYGALTNAELDRVLEREPE